MKTEKAFALIGKKLEKEFKRFRFKYSKKNNYLKKLSKKYDYYIFFASFFENISDTNIELHVTLMIYDRILLKTNKYSNSQLFNMNLWEMGNHYNISNETLLFNVFMDLKNKIEDYLIPQIKKLEEKIP
jgi:hypothetical protein